MNHDKIYKRTPAKSILKTQFYDCLNYSLRRATDEHLNNIKYGLLIIIKYNRIKMWN